MAPRMKMLPLLLLLLATTMSNAQEDIRLPPSITESPSQMGYYGDRARVVLRCVAYGVPTPTMTWTKDGSPLSFVGIIPTVLPPGNGTIEIVQMNANHSGTYRCLASSEYGNATTDLLVVQLATLNSFDLNAPRVNYTVQANAALRLLCIPPTSVPQAQITWSWNSTAFPLQNPVIVSRSYQIDYTGSLCFASVNITEVQNRLYRCNAFNEGTQGTSSGAYSRIIQQGSVTNAAPQFVFSTPSPYIGLRSQQTILRCFFSGTGTMTYQWTYNGASALPPGWTSVETDVRSPETGTADTDAGLFICYGNNAQGTPVSHSITLTVEAIPDFGATPEVVRDVNVTEGDAVTFSCATNAIPQATVQWYKNAQLFTANSLPPKFSLSADLLTLTIADLCKNCSDGTNDLMVVQCISTNSHGHAFAQGYVNVLLATVIESVDTSVDWVPSETYVFDCLATCDDSTPCTVQWSFGGNVIQPDGDAVVIGDDGSLTINTTNDSDAGFARIGDYECLVTNGYSQQTIVCSIIGRIDVAGASLWWVGLLVALLVLLLLLLLLLCCFFFFCREAKSYPVDENERKNGNDPVKELQETGFQDYIVSKQSFVYDGQPVDPSFVPDSAVALNGSYRVPPTDAIYIVGAPPTMTTTTTNMGYPGPPWDLRYNDDDDDDYSIAKRSESTGGGRGGGGGEVFFTYGSAQPHNSQLTEV